ncbi:hypothetical protein C1645_818230 [Glomus cerebriforme]|uniref:Uncharacterized protein n=1 Tax=Glomus cerebriforme TaxID=658196 RepID=A0A397THG4_9GLOM|nr:hypothetical protein C1645_818230 [Glomus cerebriforme]
MDTWSKALEIRFLELYERNDVTDIFWEILDGQIIHFIAEEDGFDKFDDE